jgi:hypothetical protein
MTRVAGFVGGFLLLLIAVYAGAQERCGFDLREQALREQNRAVENPKDFERWMVNQLRSAVLYQTTETQSAIQIPVVVHVIHNGITSPSYIPKAQVLSQIKVLNNDFQRLNADRTQTPAIWQPIAAAMDVEFVLAKRDPLGLPTDGIVYAQGKKSTYDLLSDEAQYKALSYWPAEQYLNVWVVPTPATSSLIGLASFPQSTLPGLEEANLNRLTDGVSVDHKVFGSIDDGPFVLDSRFNKGRTLTHEIGHFFGLRHIWGDVSGCNGTDYVDDTPRSASGTRGCPNHPVNNSCGAQTMFQNYMDLSDDLCMNLYTIGQVGRMNVVLQNSPRRASLASSPGALAPVRVNNDLLALAWDTPTANECAGTNPATIRVVNAGLNPVTSATIRVTVNNAVVETALVTLALDTLKATSVTLSPLSLPTGGTYQLAFEITSVNGTTDGNAANNRKELTVQAEVPQPLPQLADFDSGPQGWTSVNLDNDSFSWFRKLAPNASPSNQAFTSDFYNNQSVGSGDLLVSPVLDLTAATSVVFRFDRAYARFPGNNLDTLKVVFLNGCGINPAAATVFFRKAGSALTTAADMSAPFTPNGPSQWTKDIVAFGDLSNRQRGRVGLLAINGNGNNLYVDNAEVLSGTVNDLALIGVEKPAPVFCATQVQPELRVQNLGTTSAARLQIATTINGATTTQLFPNANLASGENRVFRLNPLSVNVGTQNIQFTISNPDQPTDEIPANNTLSRSWVVNTQTDRIPLRQKFDTGFGSWAIQNETGFTPWSLTDTNFGRSAIYAKNARAGAQAWLVSPVLNLRPQNEAAVFFDVSYARTATARDRLQVLASEDCGVSFNQVVYSQSLETISVANSSITWIPVAAADWRTQSIDLTAFAGKENVRLAWVVTNDNGNNVYVDNIEFFVSNDPEPPRIERIFSIYPNPANPFEQLITFNLPQRENLQLQVVNTMGQTVLASTLPDVLNQTYTLELNTVSTGVYIFRIGTREGWYSAKVFIGK